MSIQSADVHDPIARDHPAAGVRASITFAAPAPGRRTVRQAAPGEPPARQGPFATHDVFVADARPRAGALSLDREGFVLTDFESALREYDDPEAVRAVYYREVENAVEAATGARAVIAFDHNVRVEGGPPRPGARGAVRVAHNDYTARSGPQRVRDVLPPDDAALFLAGRFAVINLWRPIAGPVEQWPLALAEANSVAPSELIETDLVYDDRVGEIYEVAWNAGQRWSYVPAMEADEALLIKGYDSRTDGTARFTPHTGFADPTSPPDAAPRHSVEVRTLVYYGPDG